MQAAWALYVLAAVVMADSALPKINAKSASDTEALTQGRKKSIATLTYSSVGGINRNFEQRQLVEGVEAWTDRDYVYTETSSSGIPIGSTFWAGPVDYYPGTDRTVTLTAATDVTFYFWSEDESLAPRKRDGDWPNLYSAYRTGGFMTWLLPPNLRRVLVYRMHVAAGQSVGIQIGIGNTLRTYEFIGGFAVSPATMPSPTPAPTPSPTPTPAPAAAPASAVGDPHLRNIHGETFDLMQTGRHVFIHIPRKSIDSVFLRVVADAKRMGADCADIYLQDVNITGAWADARKKGGFRYLAQDFTKKRAHWVSFGHVQLKVAHGRTQQGIKYLNIYVKNLDHTEHAVGGLLGEDDHTKEEVVPANCRHLMAL